MFMMRLLIKYNRSYHCSSAIATLKKCRFISEYECIINIDNLTTTKVQNSIQGLKYYFRCNYFSVLF